MCRSKPLFKHCGSAAYPPLCPPIGFADPFSGKGVSLVAPLPANERVCLEGTGLAPEARCRRCALKIIPQRRARRRSSSKTEEQKQTAFCSSTTAVTPRRTERRASRSVATETRICKSGLQVDCSRKGGPGRYNLYRIGRPRRWHPRARSGGGCRAAVASRSSRRQPGGVSFQRAHGDGFTGAVTPADLENFTKGRSTFGL